MKFPMVESQCAAVQSYNLLPVAVRTTLHQHNVCSRVGIIVKVSQNVWKMRYCPLRLVERDVEKWFLQGSQWSLAVYCINFSRHLSERKWIQLLYLLIYIFIQSSNLHLLQNSMEVPLPYVPLASISKKYWHCYKIFYLENAIFLPEYFLGM